MMPHDWLRPRTVAGLAGLFGLIFALGSFAIGAALYLIAGVAFDHAQQARIERERVRLMAPVDGAPPSTAVIAERIRKRAAEREITSTGHMLTDASGRRIAGVVEARMPGPGQPVALFRQPGDAWEPGRAVRLDLPDGAQLTIVAESESAEDMAKIIWPLFVVALVLAVSIGVLASLWLGYLIASRLTAIGTTATAIIAGDYSRRVPVDSLGGTFAEQARIFNRMLDRIEMLMDNLRQVSSDIAHDLRTPLTRLQATLREAAAEEDEAERMRRIDGAQRECDGILALFASLLRIGEVEGGRRRALARPIRLDPLVEDIVESYAPVFADGARQLVLVTCDECQVQGDADLFNQLLVNLIENALFHTPEGSTAWISLSRETGAVELLVRDDGPGIPVGARVDVLRRFVRLERSRGTPGHGLGLSLVAAIAQFHEGQIELDDGAPGLLARVRFPAAAAATF